MWHLKVKGGEQDGVAIDLADGAYLLGGDQEQADIVLSHTDVQPRHLSFKVDHKKLLVLPENKSFCSIQGFTVAERGRTLTGHSTIVLGDTVSLELNHIRPPETVVQVAVTKSKTVWVWLMILALPMGLSALFLPKTATSSTTDVKQLQPAAVPDVTAPAPVAIAQLEEPPVPKLTVKVDEKIEQKTQEQITAALASRYQLRGVVRLGRGSKNQGRGLVLLAVDGNTAKTYAVGAEIDNKLKVVAITEQTASLGEAEGKVAIVLTLNNK